MDILLNVLIGVGVFSIIALAVIKIVKDKKAGKSSCGAGCGSCSKCDTAIAKDKSPNK